MSSPTLPLDVTTNHPSPTTIIASPNGTSTSLTSGVASSSTGTNFLPSDGASGPSSDPDELSVPPSTESTTSIAGSNITSRSTNPNAFRPPNYPALSDHARTLLNQFETTAPPTRSGPRAAGIRLGPRSMQLVNALNASFPNGAGMTGAPERDGAVDLRAARAAAHRARADRLSIRLEGSEVDLADAVLVLKTARVKYKQAEAEWDDFNDNEIGGVDRLLEVADRKAALNEARREVRTQTSEVGSSRRELRWVLNQLAGGA